MSNIRCSVFTFFGSLCIALSANALGSHPYHVSLTEIEWNANTGNFEVAVCIWPADLEKALSLQEQNPVNLDKTPDLDQIVIRYVKRTITCCDNEKDQADIRWVGLETNNKNTWLYFEFKPRNRPGIETDCQWTLQNKLLFELNADQLNQINFKCGKRNESIICSADRPVATLNASSTAQEPSDESVETDN